MLPRRAEQAERRVEGLTRDEVCRAYAPKVQHLARRLHQRLAGELVAQVDDLAAAGAIGLLEAFERFEPDRGIKFSTFAEYRIRGAMYDSLRDDDAFSRRRRQLSNRIQAAGDEVRRAEGRAPEPAEVAERLGMGLDAFHEARDVTKPVVHLSIEDGSPVADRLADPSRSALQGIVAHEVRAALKRAIEDLPERMRHAVVMYYSRELTLAEIAVVLGVTVSRVSQILTEARARLRRTLLETVDPDDLKAAL